jgi:hypothetical protein
VRTIFNEAVARLADPDEDPSVREAMAAMVSAAFETGVEGLPGETALVLFRWLITGGAGRSWTLPDALGRVRNEAVTHEAVEVLRRDSSQEVRDATFRVLSGTGHAPLLDDDLLLQLVPRHERDGQPVARLVEAVHEYRGVRQQVLVTIRDQLLYSHVVEARLGSIILGTLTEFSPVFWRQMIHDPSSQVRSEAIRILAKEGEPHASVRIIAERLHLPEPVVVVKAELLSGLGKLVFRMSD